MNYQYVKTKRIAYPFTSGVPALQAPQDKQLLMHSIALVNGSASPQTLGIGIGFSSAGAFLFQDVSGTVSSYSAGPLLASNNDKLYVQAKSPLDFVSFAVGVVGTNDGVYVYEYWNGSAWTALTPQVVPNFANAQTELIIAAPLAWATGDGGIPELNSTLYSFRIVATTAPGTPPELTEALVARFYTLRELIGSKEALEATFEENQTLLEAGEYILPYFGAASNFSAIELGWRINP